MPQELGVGGGKGRGVNPSGKSFMSIWDPNRLTKKDNIAVMCTFIQSVDGTQVHLEIYELK